MSNLGEIITTAVNEQLSSIPAQRLIEKLSLIKNRLESSKKDGSGSYCRMQAIIMIQSLSD